MLIEQTSQKNLYENAAPAKTAFSAGNFLQSWQWGEFQEALNAAVQRILIKNQQQKIIGRASLLKKTIPSGKNWGLTYFYCPFGPEIAWGNLTAQQIQEFFKALTNFLKKKKLDHSPRADFLRFNLPMEKNPVNQGKIDPKALKWDLCQAKTKEPVQTLFLDLTKSEEILLKEMKAKTRYNIRLAGKKNLVITKGSSREDLENFWQLTQTTSNRNEFRAHSKEYYAKMAKILGSAGLLKIYTASFQEKPIAAILVIFYQDTATYLHGASANEFRNLMAPYLLQWQAIRDAKTQNLKFYDFWGIDEQKWPGVTRFKMGFGGNIQKSFHSYEIGLKAIPYLGYKLARKIF